MSRFMKALIVEDEPLFALVLERILKQSSFECMTVTDSEQARRCLARSQFDLILLDLQLPDAGGPALVEDVERHAAWSGRAMVVTSFPTMGRIFSTALPVVDKTNLPAMQEAIERFVAGGG